jgi:hypothetical protein
VVSIVAAVGTMSPDGTPFSSLGNVLWTQGLPAEFSLNNDGWIAFRATTGLGRGMFLWADGALEELAVIGDVAPNGATYTSFAFQTPSGFPLANRPALSDAGEAAFLATTSAGLGLFAVVRGGTGRTVAMRGDPLPGGGRIDRFSSSAYEGHVGINTAGAVAFFADPVGGYTQGGVFLATGGGLQKIVRVGDAAPGGGTFSGFGGCCYVSQLGLNDAGDVTFYSWIDGTSLRGLFRSYGGVITKVVTTGDPAPGGGTFAGIGFEDVVRHTLSDSGAVVFDGYLEQPIGPFRAAFLAHANGTLTHIARDGDPAPTRPSYRSFSLGTDSITASGALVFHSDVSRGAIFLADGSGIQKVAAVGDPAPGGGTLSAISPFATPPTINESGEIAFVAFFDENDERRGAVYAGTSGSLRRVAATGDAISLTRTLDVNYTTSRAIIDADGGITFTADTVARTRRRAGVFRSVDDVLTPLFSRSYSWFLADATASGEVAFSTSKGPVSSLYLTTLGRPRPVLRLRSSGDVAISLAGPPAVNAGREIAFATAIIDRSSGAIVQEHAITFRAANGSLTPVATADYTSAPDLNDAGEVLFSMDGDDGTGVFRWQSGTTTPVVVVGDATPAGLVEHFSGQQAIAQSAEVVFVATVNDGDGSRSGLFRSAP